MNHKRKSNGNNTIPMIVLFSVLVIALGVVIGIAIQGDKKPSNGTSNEANNENSTQNGQESAGGEDDIIDDLINDIISGGAVSDESGQEEDTAEKWQEGTISHNGKYYKYNSTISTYLFMGIDKLGKVETAKNYISGGQSDALFLLVANAKENKLSIITIQRNTMTKIKTNDYLGVNTGDVIAQICVQHGFGDGKKLSCSRVVDAVEYLFYNIPINGYLAMNMGGIPTMNDAIGGVEVEILYDVNDSAGVSLKKGEVKNLTGAEAYAYLHHRELTEFDSASERLRREEQYMSAYLDKVRASSDRVKTAMKVYEQLEDYIVTDLIFADFAEDLAGYDYSPENMYTIPGKTVMGKKFEEYHVDDEALYDLIIQIFYEEVEN